MIKEVSTNGNVLASKSAKENFEKILPISLNKPPSPPLEPNAVIIHKYFLKKKIATTKLIYLFIKILNKLLLDLCIFET